MRQGLMAIALSVAACGRIGFDALPPAPDAPPPNPEQGDGFTSGSRLKLQWYQFADGTKEWTNQFYDSERNEICIQWSWSDGELYCTPYFESAGPFYLDSACSLPIGVVSPTTTTPSYFIEQGGCASSVTQHLYKVGSATAPVSIYDDELINGCTGPFTDPGDTFYEMGTEVTTEELVLLSESATSGTGAVGVRALTTSDGLTVPWMLHDEVLAADCLPRTSGAALVCAPSDTAGPDFPQPAADTGCTQPVEVILTGCGTPPFGVIYNNSTCSDDYYAAGALYTGTVYDGTPGSCNVDSLPTSETAFYDGAPVALQNLSSSVGAVAGHRIQHEYAVVQGGRMRNGLYDTSLAIDCLAALATDGVVHCVPNTPSLQTFYSDAMCSNAIEVVLADGIGCALPTSAPRYTWNTTGSAREYFVADTPYTGALYVMNGTCSSYTVEPPSAAYAVGAVVDPTIFEPATIVIDP